LSFIASNSAICDHVDHLPRFWFDLFKDTPAKELIEENHHAELRTTPELLNDVSFISLVIKTIYISYTEK